MIELFFVVHKAKGWAAREIRQAGGESWGAQIFVISEKQWQECTKSAQTGLAKATSGQRKEWFDAKPVGPCQYGIWLKPVKRQSIEELARGYSKEVTSVPQGLWVPSNAYESIRSRHPELLMDCVEQPGFASIPPRATSWVPSTSYYSQQEFQEYKRRLSQHNFSSQSHRLEFLAEACDPQRILWTRQEKRNDRPE